MNCPTCYKEFAERKSFCPQCGSVLPKRPPLIPPVINESQLSVTIYPRIEIINFFPTAFEIWKRHWFSWTGMMTYYFFALTILGFVRGFGMAQFIKPNATHSFEIYRWTALFLSDLITTLISLGVFKTTLELIDHKTFEIKLLLFGFKTFFQTIQNCLFIVIFSGITWAISLVFKQILSNFYFHDYANWFWVYLITGSFKPATPSLNISPFLSVFLMFLVTFTQLLISLLSYLPLGLFSETGTPPKIKAIFNILKLGVFNKSFLIALTAFFSFFYFCSAIPLIGWFLIGSIVLLIHPMLYRTLVGPPNESAIALSSSSD